VISPLIAGAALRIVAKSVSTKKAAEARQAKQNELQVAMTGNVAQHLHQRQIYYNRFTFQRLDAAPRASIRFDDLCRATGAAGVSNALSGLILLRFDRPNQCDVSGTLDLANIRYSFPVDTTSGRWWSESLPGSGLVGSTNPSVGAVAAPNPAFGPVFERVIQARETGTNSFLDLDTGRLATPPPEVTASTNPFEDLDTGQLLARPPDAPEGRPEAESTGILKGYGPALDIPQGAHRLKYIAWLRESGADLMFNSQRQLLGFDAVFPMARSVSVTNRDDWENLTAEQVRTAVEAVGWTRRAAEAIRTGQPVPPDPGAIYASAAQIGSPWGGAPVVNLLRPEQSVTWFFGTREGGAGVLQIVGFSEIPLGVKIRYRLVQDGATSRP
jgi:hypothetical protein